MSDPRENTATTSRLTPAQYGTAFALFAVLTVVFTWPMAINLAGIPGGDTFIFTHCFWWYKKALFSLQNPFFTNYIFYPEGVNLAFQTGTFGNFLLALPVTLLAGPVVGVNVAFLLTFILAAWFTFLLAHRLTGDMTSALAAAFIYSFSVMHYGHGVGHLNVASIHCLPAVLYGLYRTFESRSWTWTVISGVFLGLTILTDQLQTIMVAGFVAAVFIWCLLNHKTVAMKPGAITARFVLFAAIGAVIASPYLYAVIAFMGEGSAALERGMFAVGGSNVYSADLFGFFLQMGKYGALSNKLDAWFAGIMNPRPFLGFTVIALLLVQALAGKKRQPVRWFWLAAAFPFVLSLGPTLHVAGRWQFGTDGTIVRLPFYYLAELPLFAQIRTPDRFHIATSFAVALIAGYALMTLRSRLAERFGPGTARAVLAALMILMVVEYLPGRAGTSHKVPDSPVLRSMAREPNSDPLLWLPLSRSSSFARNGLESAVKAMYFQTIHDKPILNGTLSRVSEERLDFNDPLLDLMVMAGNLDRTHAVGSTPVYEEWELNQVCQQAIANRSSWLVLKEKYRFRTVVIQAPFSQPGWATRRFVDCLMGRPVMEEPQSGLSFIPL